jgi:hypothetical protein
LCTEGAQEMQKENPGECHKIFNTEDTGDHRVNLEEVDRQTRGSWLVLASVGEPGEEALSELFSSCADCAAVIGVGDFPRVVLGLRAWIWREWRRGMLPSIWP